MNFSKFIRPSISPTGRRRFTMVELLMVMVVITILITMMMPAFERLALGSGVQGAARAVSGQLRMARQHAITSRERVALLMPAGEISEDEKKWIAYRPCIVDNSNNWVAWVPNTEWQFVPTGAVIAQVGAPDALGNPPSDSTTMIADVPGEANAIRAIVFTPTGRLVGTNRILHIVEGAVANGQMIIRNRDNYRTLEVDTYTGRTSYKDEQL